MRFKQKQPVVQTAINNALSGGGGGTGGTTDYTELENKPQINSVTLSGNKTTSDLGIDEVPEVTSEDNGKILKATYSEGTGSYAWESAGGFTQVQANWNETDNTDPSYIQNKPSIPAAQVNSDWTANSGVAQILNKPDLSDMATQTWVGQQGYLTDADEVPQVTSSDDGKVLTASYNSGTGTGSYNWATLASGTTDYTELENKPSINGVTLSGNKTASDLGLISAANLFGNVVGDYTFTTNRDNKMYVMGTSSDTSVYDVSDPIIFNRTENHAFFIITIDRPTTTPSTMPNPSNYACVIWGVAYTGTSSNAGDSSGAQCFSATATTNAFGTSLDTAKLVSDVQNKNEPNVYRRLGVVGGQSANHLIRVIVVQID